ncbi:MAG: site-specific integrase [Microthrixaceae bacterium]|nr:site-specific integrase [Microthrixaceae bacterium]
MRRPAAHDGPSPPAATTARPSRSRPYHATATPEAGSTASPSGRYRVRIVTPGGRRLSLGTHPTKRSAEAAYGRSVTDQADGKSATPSAVTTPTLADYASSWVDTRLTKRGEPVLPRVKDLYLMQLRLHIVPAFGTSRLARMTTAQVRDWNARLRGPEGPGTSTAAKGYRLLRSILATAVEDGLIPSNPCTIKGAGVEPADERPIPTVAQVHDLVEQLPERMRCVVLLAAFVGLRRGEILGLRRGDIDLDLREIAIVRQRPLDGHGNHLVGPPKSEAGRRVLDIPKSLIADLRNHLDDYAQAGDDGCVFTGQKGGPLAPASGRTPGPRREPRSAFPRSTSTTSAIWLACWRRARAAAPRRSCTTLATAPIKPPSSTKCRCRHRWIKRAWSAPAPSRRCSTRQRQRERRWSWSVTRSSCPRSRQAGSSATSPSTTTCIR